jgi:hypothetical protein
MHNSVSLDRLGHGFNIVCRINKIDEAIRSLQKERGDAVAEQTKLRVG